MIGLIQQLGLPGLTQWENGCRRKGGHLSQLWEYSISFSIMNCSLSLPFLRCDFKRTHNCIQQYICRGCFMNITCQCILSHTVLFLNFKSPVQLACIKLVSSKQCLIQWYSITLSCVFFKYAATNNCLHS